MTPRKVKTLRERADSATHRHVDHLTIWDGEKDIYRIGYFNGYLAGFRAANRAGRSVT